jgi:membrane-associated protein
MELIGKFIDLIMHLDVHLNSLIVTYQLWTYLILFAVIFCETGLVITPFLPGDSLLFATGALAASPSSPLHVGWLFLVLGAAAVLGDTVNYWIGYAIGPKIFQQQKIRFLKK